MPRHRALCPGSERADVPTAGGLSLERRADGSLLLRDPGSARRGVGLAGIGLAALLVAGIVGGGTTPLEGVVLVPVAVIALLGGMAALRHRDWVLLDRAARTVLHRRGLPALFRAVAAFSFDDVEAIVVERLEGDGVAIGLRRAGGELFPLDRRLDGADVARLVDAVRAVGGWPVKRNGRGPVGKGAP